MKVPPVAKLEWTRWLFERVDESAEGVYARPEAELLRQRADLVAQLAALDGRLVALHEHAKVNIPKDWSRERIRAAKRMAQSEDDRIAREEIREERRLLKLIATFHSLAAPREFSVLCNRAVETVDDAVKVAAHASQSEGTRSAAAFIVHVVDQTKPFDRARAMGHWDAEQQAAFLAWEAKPWWCPYLKARTPKTARGS